MRAPVVSLDCRFFRFSLVGAIGFTVDGAVLQALVTMAGWGPVEARAVAIPVAVLATWQLNRTVTFREPQYTSVLCTLGRYVSVSGLGAAVNFTVYALLVSSSSMLAAKPLAPLAVASAIALVFNYLGSKHFAFR